jgi:hypothetical protein
VPHISLVFREMWDSTALDLHFFSMNKRRLRFVESHISRKTSEMWGTRLHLQLEIWLVALQTKVAVLEDSSSRSKEQSRSDDDQDEAAGVMQQAHCPVEVSLGQDKQ